jgi:acetyl/propionyl-CoA carboxylase alpha subunit
MKLRRVGQIESREVEIIGREGSTVSARIDGREVCAMVEPMADGSTMVTIAGRRTRTSAAWNKGTILVAAGAASFEFRTVQAGKARTKSSLASPVVEAPMPGKVLKILVGNGVNVSAGEALIVLEAMKMETTLYAEGAGVISKICVVEGQMVDHGAKLIELSAVRDSSNGESPVPAG